MNASETQPARKAPAKARRSVFRWAGWSLCGLLLVGGAVLAWAMAANSRVRVQTYEVVNVYPHDAGAFTQGLAFDDEGQLYEGTGLYGESWLTIPESGRSSFGLSSTRMGNQAWAIVPGLSSTCRILERLRSSRFGLVAGWALTWKR